MAKAKNYSNYAEVVGNVATIFQNPANNRNGEMRFSLANHRSFTKKDGSKGEETHFLNILVRPGRKWAKQESVTKGAFIRVVGHLENNSYQTEDGTWKGGLEINADKITVLMVRGDGKVENTETGEVEQTTDETVEIAEA